LDDRHGLHPAGEFGEAQDAVTIRVKLVEKGVDLPLRIAKDTHDVKYALHLLAAQEAVAVEVHVVEQEENLLLPRAGLERGADANRRVENVLIVRHGRSESRGASVNILDGDSGLKEIVLPPFDDLQVGHQVDPTVQRVVEDLCEFDRERWGERLRRTDAQGLAPEGGLAVAKEFRESGAGGEAKLHVVLGAVKLCGNQHDEHFIDDGGCVCRLWIFTFPKSLGLLESSKPESELASCMPACVEEKSQAKHDLSISCKSYKWFGV
jgi:hypothetical protein